MTHESEHQTARDSFAAELSALPFDQLLAGASGAAPAQVQHALSEPTPSLEMAAVLLKAPPETLLEDLLVRAHAATEREFSRSVLLFAPFFLSNFCVNYCRYCRFSFKEQVPRRWISPARAAEELAALARRGFKRVVLVAGEYPSVVTRDYLFETLIESRPLVPELDLDVGPVDEKDYRRWRRAGAEGVVCFQETYDAASYTDLHPRGPKSRYAYRLGTPERAAMAGVERLGLGVLLGLGSPARDVLAVIAHARFLQRRFPDVHLTVSLPRLVRSVPGFVPPSSVGDQEMLKLVAVLRLALPRVGLVASAREPAWLRERLLRAGITHMSADSVIEPSAHVECQHDGGENEVLDHRSVYELRWDLEDLGYHVQWTDPAPMPDVPGAAPAAHSNPS